MHISDKIKEATEQRRPFWSFEYFPPKTSEGVENLHKRAARMSFLGPTFVDVTWGAGGYTADKSLQVCAELQQQPGLETCLHLTCTNMSLDVIDRALEDAKAVGIQNILALRGDPPRREGEAADHTLVHAKDLVSYIRQKHGEYFCIGVVGYPEAHPENRGEDEIAHLKEKVDAGADFVISQMFFDTKIFIDWLARCRQQGIDVPILPGILAIQSYKVFRRVTSLCKICVPANILEDLEPIKDDDAAVKAYGVQLGIGMLLALRAEGVLGFHFFTLNLERSVRRILQRSGVIAESAMMTPVHGADRLAQQNVIPMFATKETLLSLTSDPPKAAEDWDEFPNGRWGDARSAAFGEIDGYGVSLKLDTEQALGMWGKPTTGQDIGSVFVVYVRGEILRLPWCDEPLHSESELISDGLIRLNESGYWTINSQPAVDGVPSSDPVFGWGPPRGYVYQKPYVEFFTSKELLDALLERTKDNPYVSYIATNRKGELRTNMQEDQPNALTWGVFPEQEIVQPTMIERMNFVAWAEEAFLIWDEWKQLYPSQSQQAQFIGTIADSCWLVNVVHHNFKDRDALFTLFSGP